MGIRKYKKFSLGWHLVILVASAIIPIVVFSVNLVNEIETSKQEAAKKRLLDDARALANAVDRETESTIRTLQAISASSSLRNGDIETFYAEARRVLENQASWLTIILFSKHGEALLNTLHPLGEQRRFPVESESLKTALQTGVVVVGVAGKSKEGVWAIPIRVPVNIEGELKYILTAVIPVTAWQKFVIDPTTVSDENVTRTIVDYNGQVIARSRSPDKFVGKKGTPSFLNRVKKLHEAIVEEVTLDNIPVFLAHSHSRIAKWSVAVGASRKAILSPVEDSILAISVFGFFLLITFVCIAFYYGYRISQDISKLAYSAKALIKKRTMVPVRSRVKEVDQLSNALKESERLISKNEQAYIKTLKNYKEAKQLAEDANKAKDHFLAMLGHELRNPLGAVTSAIEVLRDKFPKEDSEVSEIRNIIERQLTIANALLNDLLEASRINRGMIVLKQELLDLKTLVSEILDDNNYLFMKKNIKVERKFDEGSVWISGDRGRLSQALGNILHNAYKFTPSGGDIKVVITVNEDLVNISVIDSGIGFDDEILPKLFEPFSQATQDSARSKGGLGLGLSVVKGLIELHGGHVSAKNRSDREGAIMSFALPRSIEAAPEKGVQTSYVGSKARRILLVEDNFDVAIGFKLMLAQLGHSVEVAKNGHNALLAARTFNPDTVLCDLGLPDINGYEVCKKLRKSSLGKKMKIIAISGYGQNEDVLSAKNAGFDLHLTKPVTIAEIQKALA